MHSDVRHAPRLRRGRDEHLADRRADLAQRIPVGRRRRAAAGVLPAVLRLVEIGLLDPDALPLDVELVGDDHRQRGLDALPDLRVLRDDGDDVVGVILMKALGHEGGCGAAVPARTHSATGSR